MGEVLVYRAGRGVVTRAEAAAIDAASAPQRAAPVIVPKVERGRWVWRNGELIDAATAPPLVSADEGPQVIRDIEPYRATKTGEVIGSRTDHRAYLRRHGFIEVGNEREAMKPTRPEVPDARRDVAHALRQHGWMS